jgi:hypothetical protein
MRITRALEKFIRPFFYSPLSFNGLFRAVS